MMLVGIFLLMLQLPNTKASEPDSLLIYFAVIDNPDEVFTDDSFKVTGVDDAVVTRDLSKKTVIVGSKLKTFYMISFAQLPAGEYVLVLTVTDKGGLTATKDFRIVVTVNTAPSIETDVAEKSGINP